MIFSKVVAKYLYSNFVIKSNDYCKFITYLLNI